MDELWRRDARRWSGCVLRLARSPCGGGCSRANRPLERDTWSGRRGSWGQARAAAPRMRPCA